MTPRQLYAGEFQFVRLVVVDQGVGTIVLALQGSRTILALIAIVGAVDVREQGVRAERFRRVVAVPRIVTADTSFDPSFSIGNLYRQRES